jgi:hypothetical protein
MLAVHRRQTQEEYWREPTLRIVQRALSLCMKRGIGAIHRVIGRSGSVAHWQTLLTHVWPFLHFPQLSAAPQPSEVVPQFMPSPAHVTGVQPPVHTLLVQVCPDGQVPQSSVPPQPSEAVPQLKLLLMHVV